LTPYGPLVSVAISPNQDGKSKAFPTNFGFANFADHASAQKALTELNGKTVENVNAPGTTFEVYVSKAQKKTERTREIKAKVTALDMERTAKWTGMNLFVKNLDESITDEVLNETFAKYGTITSAKIVRDETVPGSPSKGFGYVCFSSPEEATLAVSKLNGLILRSKPITVALHQTKAQRDAHLSATSRYGGMRFPQGGGGQFPGNRMPGGPGQAAFQFANYPPGSRGQQGRGGQQGGYGGMPQPYNAYNMGPSMGPGLRRGMPLNNNNVPNNRIQNRPNNTGARGGPPMNGNRSMMPPNMMPAPRQGQGVPPAGYQQRNMMRPDQVMMMPPQQMQQQPMPVVNSDSAAPLDDHALAAADPQEQKNMIGERLYPLIYRHQPSKSGKITGMLLEMDNAELLHLIDTPDALLSKIDEALTVLKQHESGMPQDSN
jgi:polyadenylate-binding protein